ncbi:MAG: adenylate/guanylate cyclase domain-containing protein [Bacteroidota bacterium]
MKKISLAISKIIDSVAGVIGKQRFTYDVWGDTVNIASRLEQTSEPNRIQISDIVQQLVADIPKFHCTNRGEIELKGRGKMQTFWLTKPESER